MTSINIGFDFDGVITDGYSILPITLLLEGFIADEIKKSVVPVPKDIKDALSMYKERFYNRVAANEVATGGTLLRPSLLKILPELLKQRREGKISTLFIYSNNLKPVEVEIFSSQGKLVYHNTHNPQTQFSIPDLAAGSYAYRLSTDTFMKNGVMVVR